MADLNPIKVQSRPGVQRDGTRFDSNSYIDAQWCRFQRGLPRKIGGYQSITTLPQICRGMAMFSLNGVQYAYFGSQSQLKMIETDSNDVFLGSFDRTPAALAISSDTMWQFDFLYLTAGTALTLIAHPGPNLTNIDNSTAANIFTGSASATSILTDSAIAGYSGGIVVLGPYLFAYGSSGGISWGLPNSLTFVGAGTGAQNVTGQKIVKGMKLRGTGGGPGGLFWSLDSLIRCTWVGSANGYFAFDTLSADISVLSPRCILEYEGIYYWAGINSFFVFNGVVQELPNTMNINWFFDNLNLAARQRCFAFIVPRFGEIWWCYPRGMATECTHAVIYNVRERYWYDTVLPANGRADAAFNQLKGSLYSPDTTMTSGNYTIWQHEKGVDQVQGVAVSAIDSWFETHEISMLTEAQAKDKALRVGRIEPDFIQAGTMNLIVNGRANARAPILSSIPEVIQDPTVLTSSQAQVCQLKEVRRLMSFRFESNTQGGNYQMGQTMAYVEPADGRFTS